jgi:hypothetical protein
VRALTPQHAVERSLVFRLRCGHQLEEEVIPVAALARTRLGQPAF